MSFYNTIHLPKDLLIERLKKVKKQELKVLAVFQIALDIYLSPADVYFALDKVYPMTSIRRGVTNLTNKGKLVKTKTQRMGMYGTMNYCWKLNK